ALVVAICAAAFGAGCNAKPKKSHATPAASGSAASATKPKATGPCADYATKLCDKAGAASPTCQSIKSTSEILPPSACTPALRDINYTVKKLGERRKACDDLVQKLCADIGPTTQTCDMVKSKTKEFDPERCTAMMEHYSDVVAELRKMETANKPLSAEL